MLYQCDNSSTRCGMPFLYRRCFTLFELIYLSSIIFFFDCVLSLVRSSRAQARYQLYSTYYSTEEEFNRDLNRQIHSYSASFKICIKILGNSLVQLRISETSTTLAKSKQKQTYRENWFWIHLHIAISDTSLFWQHVSCYY